MKTCLRVSGETPHTDTYPLPFSAPLSSAFCPGSTVSSSQCSLAEDEPRCDSPGIGRARDAVDSADFFIPAHVCPISPRDTVCIAVDEEQGDRDLSTTLHEVFENVPIPEEQFAGKRLILERAYSATTVKYDRSEHVKQTPSKSMKSGIISPQTPHRSDFQGCFPVTSIRTRS